MVFYSYSYIYSICHAELDLACFLYLHFYELNTLRQAQGERIGDMRDVKRNRSALRRSGASAGSGPAFGAARGVVAGQEPRERVAQPSGIARHRLGNAG